MKTFKNDRVEFNYKEYLEEGELSYLVKKVLDIYANGAEEEENGELYGDNISGLNNNPLLLELMFNRILGILCIENFDEEMHKKIFESGAYEFLKENVLHADLAYELILENKEKINSPLELLSMFLKKMLSLIPEETNIKELSEVWNKASEEFKNITGENKEG